VKVIVRQRSRLQVSCVVRSFLLLVFIGIFV